MNTGLQLLIIACLTAINAFFAAAEMAMVSIKVSRVQHLKKEGARGADALYRLMQNPNKFLSTIQVGITLAGFFASASAASNLSDDGERILTALGLPYAAELSFIFITIILSYFTLVFGELFPKNVALQYREKIALSTAKTIAFISVIAAPFVWLLAKSTHLLMALFRIPTDQSEEPITRESLRKMVNLGRRQGNIDENEEFLIRRVIDLDEIYVREIMRPREQIFSVDIEDWSPDSMRAIVNGGYSRIPFYRGEKDDIIGVLLMKDLLKASYEKSFEQIEPQSLLRDLNVISENRLVDDVLRFFQKQKIHIAMVVDEYGIVVGMVTIEDILEEIVGEIDDEFDEPSAAIQESDAGYLVHGSISLHNLNRQLQLELSSDLVDTLSGYLHEHYDEEQLATGCKLSLQGYLLTIKARDQRKIDCIFFERAAQ